MVNKIILVALSILVGVFLIPIVIAGVDNAKLVDQTIEFSITSTSEVITTTLSEDDIETIIAYYDDVKSVSSILLDGDTVDIFANIDVPDTVYYEETEIIYAMDGTSDTFPITIHTDDYLVFTRTANVYNNIAYTEYYRNDPVTATQIYGFKSTGTGHSVIVNGTTNSLETGTWDSHSFADDFTTTDLDWATVGDVGTLTFLTAWPDTIDGISISTDMDNLKTNPVWTNSSNIGVFADLYITYPVSELDVVFDTATLSLNVGDYSITSDTTLKEGTQTVSMVFEIPMDNATSTILDILPILFVLIIVVGSVAYIKFNK